MDRTASSVSRRTLFTGLGALAAAAIVATTAFRPAVGDRARRMLASNGFTRRFLSLAHAEHGEWQAQVGSHFTAEGGYRLRLAGVRPLRSPGERPSGVSRDRGFIAIFDVGGGMTMAGDLIYTVAHSQYGGLPLFLSATGDPRRMFAVFN